MTSQPAVTLETVTFHWGDAYLIRCTRDRRVALRRDRQRFVTAGTLAGLETAIEADYRDNPVPRDFDPPGAADYLSPARDDPAPDARTPAGRQPPPAPAPGSPANAAGVPTWFMPHPIQITCQHCGHTLTCDASSQAARDKTCGPCAYPFPDHPSGPAA